MSRLDRYKRLLTIGHGVGFVVVLAFLYFAWGRIFQEGGTGSNVVLGLLLAVAVLWIGTNQIGPLVNEALAGDRRLIVRDQHKMFEAAVALEKAIAREKKDTKTKLSPETFAAVDATVAKLFATCAAKDVDAAGLKAVAEEAIVVQNQAFPPVRESVFMQVRSIGGAFAIALALRTFAVAPFQIPSGSMIPTLLIGDHLFVWRATYGLQIPSKNGLGLFSFLGAVLPEKPFYFLRWKTPEPGDVVVFEAPPWVGMNAGEDWIKRVVAGPGQQVRFENTVLTVDGRPYTQMSPDGSVGVDDGGFPTGKIMEYDDVDGDFGPWRKGHGNHKIEKLVTRDGTVVEHSVFNDMPPRMSQWPMRGAAPKLTGLRCTDEACTVEDGYVFVMGDNRDHSSDGRIWGAVPIDNIKGKAIFIWVSVNGSANSVKLGRFTLPQFRWERVGDGI